MKSAEACTNGTLLLFSYLTIVPEVSNFTGIRTFRVLRALRTISAVEGKIQTLIRK